MMYNNWSIAAELTSIDSQSYLNDNLGRSVVIRGDMVLAGAPYADSLVGTTRVWSSVVLSRNANVS